MAIQAKGNDLFICIRLHRYSVSCCCEVSALQTCVVFKLSILKALTPVKKA